MKPVLMQSINFFVHIENHFFQNQSNIVYHTHEYILYIISLEKRKKRLLLNIKINITSMKLFATHFLIVSVFEKEKGKERQRD